MIPDIRGRLFKTDKTYILVYEENVVDSVSLYISLPPYPHTYLPVYAHLSWYLYSSHLYFQKVFEESYSVEFCQPMDECIRRNIALYL